MTLHLKVIEQQGHVFKKYDMMKKNIKYKKAAFTAMLLLVAFFTGVFFQACKKTQSSDSGMPSISYIRLTDPAKSDSLVIRAFLGSTIAIIGQNLQDVKQVWFNDQSAFINTTFVTGSSLIVTIPNNIPTKVTNQMLLITSNRDTLKFNFPVDVPAPRVDNMVEEYVKDGGTAIIQGNYFVDDPNIPLKVIFPGLIEGKITSVSLTEIMVKVPTGAGIGQIQVKSLYGTTRSTFYFRDDRGMILNFDNLNNSGAEWRRGVIRNDSIA